MLDEPVEIKLSVSVREIDFTIYRHVPLEGAAVHYFNVDTTIISDSAGYTGITFLTNTMPYKFSYEIKKDNYRTFFSRSVWDTVTTKIQAITLKKLE